MRVGVAGCGVRAMGAKRACAISGMRGLGWARATRSDMEDLLKAVVGDVNACPILESLVCGKGMPKPPKQRARKGGRGRQSASSSTSEPPFDAKAIIRKTVKQCRKIKELRQTCDLLHVNDDTLCKYARFTDGVALAPFAPFLHYVPRLVNVVTVRASHCALSGRTPSHAPGP